MKIGTKLNKIKYLIDFR